MSRFLLYALFLHFHIPDSLVHALLPAAHLTDHPQLVTVLFEKYILALAAVAGMQIVVLGGYDR